MRCSYHVCTAMVTSWKREKAEKDSKQAQKASETTLKIKIIA